jgi:predicted NBD/HSP70 family sugar kinase
MTVSRTKGQGKTRVAAREKDSSTKVSILWLRDVLRVLCLKRTATRNEIITETGLNTASLSHTIKYLSLQGTVLKVGSLESEVGRRREVYNLNAEAAFFLALDFEQRLRFALLNLAGDVRGHWELPLEWGEAPDVEKILQGFQRLLRTLEPHQVRRVVALGISYSGMLDNQGRLTAVNLGLRKFPFVSELNEKVKSLISPDLAIFLEPDRHCAMWAERWLGQAREHRNGVLLFSESGIGSGLCVDGKPVEGWRNLAGEIGHVAVSADPNLRCRCGKLGCLETVASSPAIIRQYLASTGQRNRKDGALTVLEVFDKARGGDSRAQTVVDKAVEGMAIALSHVIHLVNPEIIILGGDFAGPEDYLISRLRAKLEKLVLPDLMDGIQIVASHLGPDMRLRGAGALALRKSLEDPKLLAKICSSVLPPAKR